MNEMAVEPRPDEHALRGSVRPRRAQRLVGLRPLAPDRVRDGATSGSARSCGRRSTTCARAAATFTIHSTNKLLGTGRGRPRRQDRVHQQGRLLPRDAAAGSAGRRRSRSSCSARPTARRGSGKRATCSTGWSAARRAWSAATLAEPAAARISQSQRSAGRSRRDRLTAVTDDRDSGRFRDRPIDLRTRAAPARPDGRVRSRAVGQDRRPGGRRRRAAGRARPARPRRHARPAALSRRRRRRRADVSARPFALGARSPRRHVPRALAVARAAARRVRRRAARCSIAPGSTASGGRDFADNAERFGAARGGRARVRRARRRASRRSTSSTRTTGRLGWCPRCCAPTRRAGRGSRAPAVVFTIHNLAYQGLFPREVVPALGLPWDAVHARHRRVLGPVQLPEGRHRRQPTIVDDGQSDLRARDA